MSRDRRESEKETRPRSAPRHQRPRLQRLGVGSSHGIGTGSGLTLARPENFFDQPPSELTIRLILDRLMPVFLDICDRLFPFARSSRARAIVSSGILGRPCARPSERARAMPAITRSESRARSCFARAARMPMMASLKNSCEVKVSLGVAHEVNATLLELVEVVDRLPRPFSREAIERPEDDNVEDSSVCVVEEAPELGTGGTGARLLVDVLAGDLPVFTRRDKVAKLLKLVLCVLARRGDARVDRYLPHVPKNTVFGTPRQVDKKQGKTGLSGPRFQLPFWDSLETVSSSLAEDDRLTRSSGPQRCEAPVGGAMSHFLREWDRPPGERKPRLVFFLYVVSLVVSTRRGPVECTPGVPHGSSHLS